MRLRRNSTQPFPSAASGSTHHAKAPLPDRSSTCGLLGAEGSALTAQRGLPLPVTPWRQALGNEPGASVSKLMVSAKAALVANIVAAAIQASFMVAPSGSRRLRAELGRSRVCETGSLLSSPCAATAV